MTDNVTAGVSTQRRSLGGYVVEAGLTTAGYEIGVRGDVALVETARPHRGPYRIVLAQNAWNVVDIVTFWRLLRKHPMRRWPRYVMRRLIAMLNLRRSQKVVCLTHAMAAMCEPYARHVVASPVTVPVDFLAASARQDDQSWAQTVLVPGTVTWHKNPVRAVQTAQQLQAKGHSIKRIVFAGSDDGSGCWQEVKSAASAAGLCCSRRQLSREEMAVACASSYAVVIPSSLESLSLSIAEALFTASMVLASDIPAHREVAGRIGRQPIWLDDQANFDIATVQSRPRIQIDQFKREWNELGQSLGLARTL